jgi:hypothetical protein
MPERIKTKEASNILGLSEGNVVSLACRGELPGAAKIGGRWTFDEKKLRDMIALKEAECLSRTSIREREYGGCAPALTVSNAEKAYSLTISKMRGKLGTNASTNLKRRANAGRAGNPG